MWFELNAWLVGVFNIKYLSTKWMNENATEALFANLFYQ